MKEAFLARWQTAHNYFATQSIPWKGGRNIFRWDFWSEGYLSSQSPYYLFTFSLVLVIVFGLLIWRAYLARKNKQIPVYLPAINHLANLAFFLFLNSIFYWFCRVQEIIYLSSRLVVLAVIIVAILWLGYIIFWLIRILPTKKRHYLEKDRFLRYLPKSRKNNQ